MEARFPSSSTKNGFLLRVPGPLSHQLPILLSANRFKVVACGRRWGKTTLGIVAAIAGHGPARRSFSGAADGARIWWVAPTSTTLRDSLAWEQLKHGCELASATVSETNREISLANGGSLAVRSAESEESLRGAGLDGLVLDEAAFVSVYVWQQVLRPALVDRRGWCLFLSTPNGRNWFHDLYERATAPGWCRWQKPSSDNPLLRRSELELVKQEIGPRRFAQEHEADFLEVEGALWPASYFDDIWAADEKWPDSFEASVLAVDPALGRTRRTADGSLSSKQGDFSAAVFVGLSGGKLWVDAQIERKPPNEFCQSILRLWLQYHPTALVFEANGFQQLLEPILQQEAERMRMPPMPAQLLRNKEKKHVRILRLDPYLASDRLRFLRGPGTALLVEQLLLFPHPNEHDDGPDALEMALRVLQTLRVDEPGETIHRVAI